MDVRVSLLEEKVAGWMESRDRSKDAKKAKTFSIVGIVLAVARLRLALVIG